MSRRTPPDRIADFKKMSRADQRQHLLDVAERCIDSAPTTLALKIRHYLESEDQDRQ